MKFPESWLREYVDPRLSTKELAHLLTMAGLEVEAIEPVAPPFSKVVAGTVLEVARHPNADRLALCRVDAGGGEPLTIVCGAPNVKAGMKVPCALVGAELPGLRIEQAKVRGVESSGMLCSARELGLSNDHSGLLALPQDAAAGTDVRSLLDLDDQLFTLKLTPNRGDCLSLRGIAREVSILAGVSLALPEVARVSETLPERRGVRLANPAACPRYCGRVIRGLDPRAQTPDWMARKIERCGLRPVSAIVDVTNYVMLEIGQPLHAFDNRQIEGEVIVRSADPGERLRLLNGEVVDLAADMLLIADEKRALALGGVMGGAQSAVSENTTEVFLESAWFNPKAVANRARRLGLSSDAAHRFERGVDFAITIPALERATQLMMEICGGKPGPITEALAELPHRAPVRLRGARAGRIIGVNFSEEQISGLLARLGLAFEASADEFLVHPPSHRFDIEIEEDLVEEVARLYGYDNIPTRPPRAQQKMLALPEKRRSLARLRERLVGREYFEVINYSFVEERWERDFCGNSDPILLENPISEQMSAMRSSLAGSLIANLRLNLSRKIDRARIFEIGRCYLRASGSQEPEGPEGAVPGYVQPRRAGGLAYGPAVCEQWGEQTRRVDFYDVKADIEALLAPRLARFAPVSHPALHPGRAASVSLEGRSIGWIGELHPKWQLEYELPAAPILFELDAEGLLAENMPQYREISNFPPVVRDCAVVVQESIPVRAILDELALASPGTVRDIRLFDLYRGKSIGEGEKSLAFRVVIQDTERTLTDEEADAAMARLRAVLTSKFGARLRA